MMVLQSGISSPSSAMDVANYVNQVIPNLHLSVNLTRQFSSPLRNFMRVITC